MSQPPEPNRLPDADSANATLNQLRDRLAQVLVGQKSVVDQMLLGLITGGHVLIEGAPGLAKTLAARLLAQAVGADFKRIQFTPDLLPADLTGSEIFIPGQHELSLRLGPLFAEIVLADEINRAPAKVQSALLEAMQERQITLAGLPRRLPDLFWVVATQNPLDQEGTYPLPEAQMDRFLLHILVEYPNKNEERLILDQQAFTDPPRHIEPATDPTGVMQLRQRVDRVYVDDKIRDYIVELVRASRPTRRESNSNPSNDFDWNHLIQWGVSPRAGVALVLASKAHAMLDQRDFVLPEDVKQVTPAVFRHRLRLTFEAEAEGWTNDRLIAKLLASVPVP